MAEPGTAAIQSLGFATQQAIGVRPGQGGIQAVQQQMGSTGIRPQQQDTSTQDLLMQLGGKLLEPKIQQIQQQKYLEGAQRVAQGEALKDIVDEQPWYASIFGPSSSVQGARTIAQMKGVDDYITSIQNDMPNLQKLGSAEFGKQITSRMSSFLTGDAVADAAIQTKMVESLGSLTKAHTKANFKYTQDTMQQSMVGYMIGGAEKLQAQAKQQLDGTMSEKDFAEVKAGFVGNLMPMEGQTPESYWGGIEAATIDALANGNHHAANVIFDSGVFASAPAEVRKKLIDARHTYEARTQETAGFAEYGPMIGQLQGLARSGQLTGNQIVAQVDKINADYNIRYGVNRPLFKRDELVSLISGNINAIYTRQDADSRALRTEARADRREGLKLDAKVKTEALKQAQLMQLIQAGAGNMATVAGFTGDEVNRGVYKGATVIEQAGGNVGEFLVRQYNNGGEHVNSLYQNQMQAGMRAAKMEGHSGQAFNKSYGLYRQLAAESGGKAAALAYLGDDGVKMMKYDSIVQQGKIAPEVAYQLAFGEALDKSRKSSDKKVGEALIKAVSSDQPGIFGRMFESKVPLTEQSQRVLTTAVAENYDMLVQNANMSDKQAMAVALDVAKKDLDVVGQYIYTKGESRRPVYEMIGADEKAAGRAFTELLSKKARASGVKVALAGEQAPNDLIGGVRSTADFVTMGALPAISRWWERRSDEPDVMIMRLPDQNGVGMFGVTITTPDGRQAQFPMDTAELRTHYEKSSKFK